MAITSAKRWRWLSVVAGIGRLVAFPPRKRGGVFPEVNPDVLITNQGLAGYMTGLDLVEKMRNAGIGIPVILFTFYDKSYFPVLPRDTLYLNKSDYDELKDVIKLAETLVP